MEKPIDQQSPEERKEMYARLKKQAEAEDAEEEAYRAEMRKWHESDEYKEIAAGDDPLDDEDS